MHLLCSDEGISQRMISTKYSLQNDMTKAVKAVVEIFMISLERCHDV